MRFGAGPEGLKVFGRISVFRLVKFGWKESEGAVLGLCLPMWSMCMPNGGWIFSAILHGLDVLYVPPQRGSE